MRAGGRQRRARRSRCAARFLRRCFARNTTKQPNTNIAHTHPTHTKNTHNRVLYVRNLPFNISSEEMYEIFGRYGAIRQIRV